MLPTVHSTLPYRGKAAPQPAQLYSEVLH